MILLFTDFGHGGPYHGQMRVVLAREAPGVPVLDLLTDAPRFNSRAAAYLLAALTEDIPEGAVVLGVVDPGVGTATRAPVVLKSGGRWFVGPGNGLFAVEAARATRSRIWRITYRPERLSASFHGRDLFAPVAAMLARGDEVPGEPATRECLGPVDWPPDLAEIIYVDHFGNAMTGLRAGSLDEQRVLRVRGGAFRGATTFGDVARGQGLWYANSCGLAEIAVNQGSAAAEFGLAIGDVVEAG
jgi:S-adenosylmethionine hydrolase